MRGPRLRRPGSGKPSLSAAGSCPICDGFESRWLFDRGGRSYLQCERCGSVRYEPRLSPEELSRHYSDDFYRRGEVSGRWTRVVDSLSRLTYRRHLSRIRRYTKGTRLLDVGCGTGDFLAYLQAAGWEICGVEPSRRGAEICRAKGLNVFSHPLQECHFPASHFDVVTLWHVIEHVPCPIALLREIGRILRPDGVLVLSTPNVDSQELRIAGPHWFHLDPPRHLVLFTPAAAEIALDRADFRVLDVRFPVVAFSQSIFYACVCRAASAARSLIARTPEESSILSGPTFRAVRATALLFAPVVLGVSSLLSLMGLSGTFEIVASRAR